MENVLIFVFLSATKDKEDSLTFLNGRTLHKTSVFPLCK